LKILALSAFIILCFLMATNAPAQNQQIPDPCDNAQTTVDMGNCAGAEYQKADEKLNRVYKQLMASLEDREYESHLKTAQQAWLKYRDAHCDFEAFGNRGGTIYPVVQRACLTTMTRARTKKIQAQMEQEDH